VDRHGARTKLDVWDKDVYRRRRCVCTVISFAHHLLYPILAHFIINNFKHPHSVLSPHADRIPLISSCIINVAQDVDEDWPLEVYGRDGLAYNVTMKPGDMVLYESHSLIHGRPFSLKGRYFANIFIHFQPTGKILHERDTPVLTDADVNGKEDMPIYILRGSPEEEHWLEQHPSKRQQHVRFVRESPAAAATPLEQIAQAAATGDVDTISHFAPST